MCMDGRKDGRKDNNTLTWGDHITNIQLRASKRLTIINRYGYALPRHVQALETLYIWQYPL